MTAGLAEHLRHPAPCAKQALQERFAGWVSGLDGPARPHSAFGHPGRQIRLIFPSNPAKKLIDVMDDSDHLSIPAPSPYNPGRFLTDAMRYALCAMRFS